MKEFVLRGGLQAAVIVYIVLMMMINISNRKWPLVIFDLVLLVVNICLFVWIRNVRY